MVVVVIMVVVLEVCGFKNNNSKHLHNPGHMPDTVLSSLHSSIHLTLRKPVVEVRLIIIPMLQMRVLRHSKTSSLSELAQLGCGQGTI